MPLFTGRDDGGGFESLVAHLDSNVWVSHQVMIPGRMGWRTNIGSDHHQVVAIAYVHHWCRAALATLGARGREQKQGTSAELAPVCSKLLDQLAVVVILICHGSSSFWTPAASAIPLCCDVFIVRPYVSTYVR